MLKTSESLSMKLANALEASDFKAADVARACGVSPQAVNGWVKTGRIDKKHLKRLSEIFNKPLDYWLDQYEVDNGSFVSMNKQVPLISWVRAGSWDDIEDHFNPADAEEWINTQSKSVSKHAFALRVEGDSMTSPTGISFPEGCVVVIDPERSPKTGDYVIAKDTITQKATFKKLATDGGRWYLKPLNTTYPAIEIDDPAMRVIGVAVEWVMAGKL